MTRFECLHCGFKMLARQRPKACGNCGKVSHERDIPKRTNAYLGDGPTVSTPHGEARQVDVVETRNVGTGI